MKTNGELRARISSLEIQLDRSKREIEQQREEFLSKGAKATNMLCDADARIADLEEAKEQLASPYMDGYEAAKEEYRPQIIALEEQLAATRKQLEELRAEYIVTLDNLSAAYESVRAQWNLGYAEGSQEVKHWRANHDNVVKKLRLFTQREDLPVDRLPAYEYVVELEKKLAAAQAREALTLNTMNTVLGFSPGDSLALEAAIADAIADEARNPWKQAIINELIVSHILHTDHETDPIKALAALVDYECKVALDPAVSKEAQELIEPYRKDAEQLDLLGKLCKETPLRPNAFCSEIAPDTRLRYDFPTLVSYDSVGNQISLRDAIDAAIAAAKGDSE